MLESPVRDPRELAEVARRVILPDLLRRRGIERLEPLLVDADEDRELVRCWSAFGGEVAPDPQRAIELRDEVAAYAARVPRERTAVLCSIALRPMLADLLLRWGLHVDVLSYAELPPELPLAPAGIVATNRSLEAV
jgi:flagellar biosynthesis component FlhA